MVTPERAPRFKPLCQSDDKAAPPPQAGKNAKTVAPASWKLTQQQQAFVDLFSADDHKKQ